MPTDESCKIRSDFMTMQSIIREKIAVIDCLREACDYATADVAGTVVPGSAHITTSAQAANPAPVRTPRLLQANGDRYRWARRAQSLWATLLASSRLAATSPEFPRRWPDRCCAGTPPFHPSAHRR